jgi:hypothetical protein
MSEYETRGASADQTPSPEWSLRDIVQPREALGHEYSRASVMASGTAHVSRKRHADRHGMCRSRTFDLGRAGDLTYMHMRSRSSAGSFSGAKTRRRCWWTATAASQIHSTAVSTRFCLTLRGLGMRLSVRAVEKGCPEWAEPRRVSLANVNHRLRETTRVA